jgi:hypothetical protein
VLFTERKQGKVWHLSSEDGFLEIIPSLSDPLAEGTLIQLLYDASHSAKQLGHSGGTYEHHCFTGKVEQLLTD